MKKFRLFLFIAILIAGVVFLSAKLLERDAVKKVNISKNTTHVVSLLSNKADPDIVLAQVGDYVQFNARDGREHVLEQGSGNAVDKNHAHEKGISSGVFSSTEAYKVQFRKVGIYSFHDHKNADIYIRIIVNERK